jgi:hypothetical protein
MTKRKKIIRCNRHNKTCTQCGHRFIGKGQINSEYDLWNCPECGFDRHCQKPVREEGMACKDHGGKSKKGMAAPNYQGGRYSKYMQGLPREDFDASLAADDLLNLTPEIALLETRVAELLRDLQNGAGKNDWLKAQQYLRQFTNALQLPADDPNTPLRQAEALTALSDTINGGARVAGIWDDILPFVKEKGALADKEIKRRTIATDFMQVEAAKLLFRALVEAVKSHVSDPDILARISEQWVLINRGASRQLVGPDDDEAE